MRFLLDTNAVIGLLGGDAGVLAGVRRHAPQDFGIPAIAAQELFYGAYRSARQAQNLAQLPRRLKNGHPHFVAQIFV